MSVLIWSEDKELAYQLLAKASELADKMGTKTYVLALDDAQGYINQGANVVLMAKLGEFAVEPYRAALLKAIEVSGAETVLIGASKRGKEIAPRIAAALGAGCMTECNNVEFVDGEIVIEYECALIVQLGIDLVGIICRINFNSSP